MIDIDAKLGTFDEHWTPRIVAELNGQHVKVAKLLGAFDWHRHPDADELFWVIRGRLEMRYRDRTEVIEAGQLTVVPRGVEHQPYAEREVEVVLFEPAGTRNTGDQVTARTVANPERI